MSITREKIIDRVIFRVFANNITNIKKEKLIIAITDLIEIEKSEAREERLNSLLDKDK